MMGVINNHSEFLSLFMALIVAGIGVKLAIQKQNNQTYTFGNKAFNRQKVHTTAMLGFLGVVIQLVSNSMEVLNGKQLLFDQKIMAAYAFSIWVMMIKR